MQGHQQDDRSWPSMGERGHHRGGRGGQMGWLWGPPLPPPPSPIDGMERSCWLCWWSFPPPPPPPAPPMQPSRARVNESNHVVYDAAGNPVHSSSSHDESAEPTATIATIISTAKGTNNSMPLPYSSRANIQYKEIRTLEYRDGDPTSRHYLTIPDDALPGQVLQVDLGGREMTVRVPETVSPGEKVIIISPVPPISYGDS